MNYIYISDVVLDVYPFGGCNSSLEAFSLGKIIVTLPGKLINGRFTSGFYKKMGLDYLICKNEKEYIDLSIELGLVNSTRFKIEKLIKEKNNILFNDKESINEWEKDLFRIYVQKML
jgi:predicted O-linked N-acetylglucosamine transferase (SPINDLY family)